MFSFREDEVPIRKIMAKRYSKGALDWGRPLVVTFCDGIDGRPAWIMIVCTGSPPRGTILVWPSHDSRSSHALIGDGWKMRPLPDNERDAVYNFLVGRYGAGFDELLVDLVEGRNRPTLHDEILQRDYEKHRGKPPSDPGRGPR